METKKFKTNINCGNCLARVSPFLDEEKTIVFWEVNTQIAEKILTVQTEEMDSEKVINAVKKAGFQIEEIN